MLPCPLAGYSAVCVPRSNRIGGDVCLYLRNSFMFSIEILSCSIKNFEYAVISFQNPSPVYVILVYKPPISPLQAFFDEINILLITNKFPKLGLFLTGDFNINFVSFDSNNFSNLLLSHNLYPTIFFPTRQTQKTLLHSLTMSSPILLQFEIVAY